jgi:hypothetical protein
MATFVRVYETDKQAAGAVKKLQGAGFAGAGLLHVTPETADAAGAAAAAGMSEYGSFAAEQAALGRSVVGVQPPFGQGKVAVAILDAAGPLAVEMPALKATAAAASTTSEAAPLSNKLGWRVLSDDPTPLSNMFGWKVKSDKTFFMVSELKNDPAPLSSMLGWKVKSDKTFFMVSELKNDPTPLSNMFGWRTKSDKRHYMVSELSNDPAPLSSKLGMKVLSDKQ